MVEEIDLSHELLLTRRQITNLRNAFNDNISTEIKLSKAQSFKIIQSGRFLGSLLSELASPLMTVAVPLEKNILAPLGNTVAVSAIDAVIQKKIHCPGRTLSSASRATTLIISDKEINDIIKIVWALEDSNILLKAVTKNIKNKTKEQKGGILSMLLGTLGASLLGNMLAGKGIVRAGYGKEWDF